MCTEILYRNIAFLFYVVRDIRPFKGTTIDPIAEGRKYHILRVSYSNIKSLFNVFAILL